MAVTPNYSWPIPVATDLVKDGYQAIADLGDAIDATVGGLGASGLTLINTTTVSAVASQSFNDVFTSTYDSYRLVVQVTGTTTASLTIRFRVGGVDTTSSSYYSGQLYVGVQSALTFGNTNANLTTSIPVGYTANGFRSGMSVDIHAPNLAQRTSTHGTTAGAWLAVNGGLLDNATVYDGFTLITGGTITGTISLYGYSK